MHMCVLTYITLTRPVKYILWGRRGRDHMVVRFTTTYAISAIYPHWCC